MGEVNFADSIYGLKSFQEQLSIVRGDSVKIQFAKLIQEDSTHNNNRVVDWNNLLSCASALCSSDKFEHLDAALRIAQTCLNSKTTTIIQKSAAIVLLEKLTNKPAIQLAINRDYINADYFKDIPLPLQLEIIKNDFNHSVVSTNDQLLYLNRFQKEVYDLSKTVDLLSISAPTSAGKSFVLAQIILEEICQDESRTVCYLVPTRALISQVEDDFRVILKKNNIATVIISSVPQVNDDNKINPSRVFIFTQERLHWFRSEYPAFKIDLLVIDEAHKISDGSRGILLQQKLEELVTDFPKIKIYFSSPFTSNPEKLFEKIRIDKRKEPIKKEFVSVNQNLIFVSQRKGKPKEWEVSLCLKSGTTKMGEILLPFRADKETKRLPFVSHVLSDPTGGNIIYVNGAAAAEKAAMQLYDLIGEIPGYFGFELAELIKLIKKTVHNQYKLAHVLKRGIAFHYGNMPLIVRQEIENLFKTGEIKYLICTSTLLEGVNLPAKSIFIRNPKRGTKNSLSESDFWNLAGRAGRWGKEFQGNVVCVEPEVWESKPSLERREHQIRIAIDDVLAERESLLEFIKRNAPREIAIAKPTLEYAFTYLYEKFLKNELEISLKKNSDLLPILEAEFQRISLNVKVPNVLLFKNPGISPIAQQNLLDYFEQFSDDLEQLIPDYPENRDAVNNSYIFIVETISTHLSGDPVALAFPHAILVVNWMKGFSLSSLIDGSYKYWKTKGKNIDWTIRETMKNVEEYARFKFAKYSSCYIDILRHFFKTKGADNLIDQIPQLNMWLEFGVSQQTQVSLISLGLSRSTAIIISEVIANDQLTRNEALKWLNENIDALDVSILMKNEINKILGL